MSVPPGHPANKSDLSRSLRSQRDASGVGDLALLQVLHQLSQPAFGGGVVLQHLGEGAVLQLVGQTLAQGFSGPEGGRRGVSRLCLFDHSSLESRPFFLSWQSMTF